MNYSLDLFGRSFFNHGFLDELTRNAPAAEFGFAPSYDIFETKTHYVVSLDVPGIAKENIKVEVVDNQLTVTGERKSQGKFRRSFTLPDKINLENVEALQADGVLKIAIPKAEEEKPKTIEVKTNDKEGFFAKLVGSDEEAAAPTVQ